jgi:hypothetical protein
VQFAPDCYFGIAASMPFIKRAFASIAVAIGAMSRSVGIRVPRSPSRTGRALERRSLLGLATLGAGSIIWSQTDGAIAASQGSDDPDPRFPDSLQRVNIRSFGAKGDRVADDGDAIRRAIARAKQTDQYPTSVFVPAGNYRRSDTIALPNQMCLFGEGISSILNSQNDHVFNKPILTNEDRSGLISARLQDLALYGGSHGIKMDAESENADLRLQNVTMLMQSSANIEANKLFQTAKLTNCILGSAPYGIKVLGTGTNCVNAIATEWLDHSDSSILLRGTDVLNVVGGRFEGGGRLGKYCIDIENSSNVLFSGCYFENVHEFLARFRNIVGAVVFQSCHFSGTALNGLKLRPFRWDLADSMITFRDCFSLQPMPVDGHVLLEGRNPGILASNVLYQGSEQSGRLSVQPRLVPPKAEMEIINIQAGPDGGAWRLRGQLTLVPGGSSKAVGGVGIVPATIDTLITAESRDIILSSAPLEVRLKRKGSDQWAITVRPNAGMSGLSWIFDWDCLAQMPAPSVRAPLT